MSTDKPRYPRAIMQAKADEFLELIRPYCKRAVIAGSLRRGREDVADIEIVAEPLRENRPEPDGLFEMKDNHVDLLHEFCLKLKAEGEIEDRLASNGNGAFGQKFKRCLYRGFPLDLFCVHDPRFWGYLLALRTGPRALNEQLMIDRVDGGYRPMGLKFEEGKVYQNGVLVDCHIEDQFFALFELPCLPPEERQTLVKGGKRDTIASIR